MMWLMSIPGKQAGVTVLLPSAIIRPFKIAFDCAPGILSLNNLFLRLVYTIYYLLLLYFYLNYLNY
jgi:hypothetical protein